MRKNLSHCFLECKLIKSKCNIYPNFKLTEPWPIISNAKDLSYRFFLRVCQDICTWMFTLAIFILVKKKNKLEINPKSAIKENS